MRWLFVPACLGLIVLSGATGEDPAVPLERLDPAAIASIVDNARDLRAAENPPPSDTSIAVPSQNDTAILQIDVPPLPKPKPEIKPVIHRSRAEVCDTLTRAAHSNGLPVPFFIHLLFQESSFSPGLVSNAGAQGVAQFMPDTATEWGVDNPFDPVEAIPASARLLRNLFEKFGNLGLAAAAYNAGPRRIQEWLAKKGPLPQETQGYVKSITGRPAEAWTASESGAPALKLPRHAPCQEAAGLLAWNGPDEIPTPVVAPHRLPKEPAVATAATPTRDAGNARGQKRITAKSKEAKVDEAKKAYAKRGDDKSKGSEKGAKQEAGKNDKPAPQVTAHKQGAKLHLSQR